MRHVDSSAELGSVLWWKSSRSGGNGGQCVEIATVREAVAVRDSKNPDGPALLFDRAAWFAFTSAVKNSTVH